MHAQGFEGRAGLQWLEGRRMLQQGCTWGLQRAGHEAVEMGSPTVQERCVETSSWEHQGLPFYSRLLEVVRDFFLFYR